jgi:hypothetical protein
MTADTTSESLPFVDADAIRSTILVGVRTGVITDPVYMTKSLIHCLTLLHQLIDQTD